MTLSGQTLTLIILDLVLRSFLFSLMLLNVVPHLCRDVYYISYSYSNLNVVVQRALLREVVTLNMYSGHASTNAVRR